MSNKSHYYALLFAALAAACFHFVNGHSFLLEPRAYNNNYDNDHFPNGCRPFECPACPRIKPDKSKNANSEDKPEVTWKRGQRVPIRWAKNNHRGGFVRMAIVPVEKMNDHGYQRRLAFYYGCWQQNLHKCDQNPCGADKKDWVLKRDIVIPAVVPDGVYSFSWVWYGGIDFTMKMPKFADYYSCSFIRIQGGDSLIESYNPFFDAGPGNNVPNTCKTGNFEPGTCTQQSQCLDGMVFNNIPLPFQNGARPPPITRDLFVPPYPNFPAGPPSGTSPPPQTSPPPATPTSSPVFPSSQPRMYCNGPYCCPGTCGGCGGDNCASFPGGAENCCIENIIDAKRYCERDPLPCKQS